MTAADLIALSHAETGSTGPTEDSEYWLARHLEEALKGCSVAFLRSHAIFNMRTGAALAPLKLDTRAVDEVGT